MQACRDTAMSVALPLGEGFLAGAEVQCQTAYLQRMPEEPRPEQTFVSSISFVP